MTLISKGQRSVLLSDKCTTSPKCLFVCLVALTSKHNASASQGWLCLDKCTCCHTETEASDNTSVHAVTLRQVSDNTSVHAVTLRQVSDNTSVCAVTLRQVSDNTSVHAVTLRQVSDNTSVHAVTLRRKFLITPVYLLPHWDRSFWSNFFLTQSQHIKQTRPSTNPLTPSVLYHTTRVEVKDMHSLQSFA